MRTPPTPRLRPVALADWRAAVSAALADGARFAGAYAVADGGDVSWRLLLVDGDRLHGLTCTSERGAVPTVVDLVPAAGWDEREAHDLHGLDFAGHEPLRPLVAHPADPGAWTVPVAGDGVHDLAVGPVHAGVIESGHFRFHVVGDRILALDAQLFYKHRGLERAAEGGDVARGLAHVQRACAACTVANGVAFAHAVEEARGLWPAAETRTARTALLELERLWSHLNDISAVCSGVGFAAGAMAFAALRERAQRLNQRLAGHRFLFGTIAVGSSELSLPPAAADLHRKELRAIGVAATEAWRSLEFATSFQARLDGVGVLTDADARRLGAVGPAARASGLSADARTAAPRLAYRDFAVAVPREPTGDVAARLGMRAAELATTLTLLDALLADGLTPGAVEPAGPAPAAGASPRTFGAGLVESPRGATLCAVELEGERVARVHLRTGSYANWPALAHAAAGNLVPDFPLINKSFELCYACVDR